MSRRQGRELSLQILYLITMNEIIGKKPYNNNLFLDKNIKYFADFNNFNIRDSIDFATKTVQNTLKHIEEIDGYIKKYLKRFPFERLPKVDLNIIRIAIYEIVHSSDIPFKVSINEANELGKKFGSKDSHRFINGVLDSMIKKSEV